MRLFYLLCLCLLLSSCGFSYLTDIRNHDRSAPTAKECGACHGEQLREWQQSGHARAFTSTAFKLQSNQYGDEECLFCHSPGNVLDPEREARNYNREEGVTCVSCHLYKQVMHGPHETGALISPHPVAQNSRVNSKMDSSQLCGVCHEETYDQWLAHGGKEQYPTCHGCHGASVRRPATKGTSLLTDLLVALEPVHDVYSHDIMLPSKPGNGIGPDLWLDKYEKQIVSFTLQNTLPHDLPAGSFGEKKLLFSIGWLQKSGVQMPKTMVVPSQLAPGQKKRYTAHLAKDEHSRDLSIELFRYHHSTKENTLIRKYVFSIDTKKLTR